ncbi:MAG TPA: type IV secretion system protein [Thermoanaerobaculia bacterium]|nr:type IV secretion system protein [Thermoanaerobaculia bacterium]
MENLSFLVGTFEQATEGWLSAALDAATGLFQRLAAIELVIFGLVVAVKARGEGAAAVFPQLIWKLFVIGMLFTGLLLYPLWIPVILESFAALAGEITGTPTLNPVALAEQGIALGMAVWFTASFSGWLVPNFFGGFVGSVAALGITLAFIAIAAILLKTQIEAWIVVAAGPLFLGFAPFRWTATLADNFLAYAFEVAIKFFFLILLSSAAAGVALQWFNQIQNAGTFNFQLVLEILAGSILLAVSLWTVPTRMADVLTRGLSFGLKQSLTEQG